MKDQMSIAPGSRFGVFEIEVPLGAGAMGEVYRARDTRLDRLVAITFVGAAAGDETARRRFQQEAKAASSLNHSNIAVVFEAGEFNDRQYLVTEYIDGGTLADWARQTKPSWRSAIDLLIGVADGLAAAHDAGILHRDIKPDNILVTRRGVAKLVDFGIAKLIQPASVTSLTKTVDVRTSPGVVIGTVAYMSPEQASGSAVDGRSDLFSFGVVLYELLAGRRPYDGKTDLEQLYARVHGPSPRIGDAGRNMPPTLRVVVEKLLEKDPAERYQSARDLVVDLRRIVRDAALPQPQAATPARWTTPFAYAAIACALAIVAASLWALNKREAGGDTNYSTPPMTGTIHVSQEAVAAALTV
jgi:serine/threonine protein kinase